MVLLDLVGELALPSWLDGTERFLDGLGIVGRIATGWPRVAAWRVFADLGLPEVVRRGLHAAERTDAGFAARWRSSMTAFGR